ncbi:Eco57I restriction-modification methylase domain-containing protein [Hydrogenophaga atypica]|uniref:site-specific DNA-methyltransferase (adenine-specific) n=1 Tax=Hydrogenophaga atypica TaxID=249409 RepID=A0ABW2QS28_9BURK
MTIDPSRFSKLLSEFKLEQLFNELGWDKASLRPQEVVAEGGRYSLASIAQKRGVVVFRCSPDPSGNIPPRATLLKIEKEATKLAHEHLLVFANAAETMLTWLWVARVPGQPNTTRTHTWHKGTSGESLRQKLGQIVWALEEEEAITLTDVIKGLRSAFDRDRVSKRFYERFKAEHEAFSAFIDGIEAATDQAWYTSLMLNRLMFVYFIQQKGFLDGNPNYLADRMQAVREKAGKGKFHTFYRQFLRRLFHEGLGQHKRARGADMASLIGDVPYLNGGLFDVHELEVNHPDIDIPDEAFQRLFTFFDAYDWHLDDRPLSSGSEINPDVLGYIFEKYINQKQMGAYYTKEDITEYISKNTVIPHLLEQARERCKVAFDGDASVWSLLKADPDRYIYPAMKTGVIDASGKSVPVTVLPDFVQMGMNDPKARMFERRYNLEEAVFHVAASNGQTQRGTLPTETWREYVERRTRCLAVRDRLASGEVKSADDLITLNLDIRQFMQDVIDTCTSPDLLRAVWQAIVGRVPERANEKFRHGIAILDPTCGSGAFLFAALNVLEPLYEACLDRMEGFVEDAKKLGKPGEADFIKVLDEVGHHHSRSYFIYKNIILHNLFGVDIMAEAVEICKLRLFLKLVSQVDAGHELEPLPDIDFNIRAGNTLVGYATEAQFDAANTLASDQTHRAEIKASTADLADAFDFFRQQQTVHGGKVTAEDKRKLRDKLNGLSLELDRYLAQDYGINPKKKDEFAAWRASHQPFHWFAEFYGVMRGGGFDVVIGNPPYLEVREVEYSLGAFASRDSNAIHAMCMERSCDLLSPSGAISMIVPLALPSTQRMRVVQQIIERKRSAWFSNFAWRPAKLFDTVNRALTIFVALASSTPKSASTKYIKWTSTDRDGLFERLLYADVDRVRPSFWVPKLGSSTEQTILGKLLSADSKARNYFGRSQGRVYYRTTGGLYWKVFTDFAPAFSVNGAAGSSSRETSFTTAAVENATPLVGILSSNCFWWWYTITSNLRDLNPTDIQEFPIPRAALASPDIKSLAERYIQDLRRNSTMLVRNQKSTGRTETQSFRIRTSKSVIDSIDIELGKLLGLSDDEVDFVINYDIKYRMGGADEEE